MGRVWGLVVVAALGAVVALAPAGGAAPAAPTVTLPTLFHTTFSNRPENRQSYPADYPGGDYPAFTGASEINTLGYAEGSAVYHVDITFPHSAGTVTFAFSFASGEDLENESWGLDDVAVLANANPVYESDFETGTVSPAWSSSQVSTTPAGGRKFLGRFGSGTVRLTLPGLPPHSTVRISFKLFANNSLDGNGSSCCGPDVWDLTVEGPTAVRAVTFGASAVPGGGATLRWRTASDSGITAFRTYASRGSARVPVGTALPAAGSPAGRSYVRRVRVTAKRYWLEVIRSDGSRSWYSSRIVRRLQLDAGTCNFLHNPVEVIGGAAYSAGLNA